MQVVEVNFVRLPGIPASTSPQKEESSTEIFLRRVVIPKKNVFFLSK
jgi:hypothetical protein